MVLSVDGEGESVPCLLASGCLLAILHKHHTDFCLHGFFFFFFLYYARSCGMQDLQSSLWRAGSFLLILLFIYGCAGSSLMHGILIVVAFLVAKHRLWGVWASVVVACGLLSTGSIVVG